VPRVIAIADEQVSSLAECSDALLDSGFDPRDEESLVHAALQLRRLGNNRDFLGDLLVEQLARHAVDDADENAYGPQVIMLRPPGEGDFFLRANIWPSADEHAVRASGGGAFVYGLPHDHNFSFLTLGYFGPGYWSSYYEYDYAQTVGHPGEPAALRFVERSRLEEGKIQLYRAHVDVHDQAAPDALSVSLNIMHACGAHGWLDQYSFDLDNRRIGRIISNGSSEAFIRIAVGLGHAGALDLAQWLGTCHPSDRVRLAAWGALASCEAAPQARDEVWRRAERAGGRLVAAVAKERRASLAGQAAGRMAEPLASR
jgi:hypothetical protein